MKEENLCRELNFLKAMKILDVVIMVQDGFGKLCAGLLMVEKRLERIEGLITNGELSRMDAGDYGNAPGGTLNPDEKLGKAQAARILKISVRTLDRYRKKGIIPYSQYNDGGKISFKHKDIIALRDKIKGNNRGKDYFSELTASSNK